MNLTRRPYHSEYDYYKIREFLCSTLLLHDRRQLNWPLYRWDYWRWHVNANIFQFKLEEKVFLWETDDNALAAVLNPDGPGEAFLQIHPRHRSQRLVEAMLTQAECCYAEPGADDAPSGDDAPEGDDAARLVVWANENDATLQTALRERGYTKQAGAEYQRWQMLNTPIPATAPIPGYTIRPQGDDSELPARSWASWRAFHPTEPDANYKGWEWYRNVQRIPIYRRDLDLVAATPSGEIAAFATVWYDEATRTGAFEPVGAQPEHQRRGLSRALINEGLRRLQALGAVQAYVSSYSPAAHAAYESAGFRQYELSEPWLRVWK